MSALIEFALLGGHPSDTAAVDPDAGRDVWYDALDVALRLADGHTVAFGFRTRGYMANHPDPNRRWGDYSPLPVTLDLDSVGYWDFNNVLWLGPDEWPCLVWSNAEALALRSLNVTFAPAFPGRLLEGVKGRGLPPLDVVGKQMPSASEFQRCAHPAAFAAMASTAPDSYAAIESAP